MTIDHFGAVEDESVSRHDFNINRARYFCGIGGDGIS